MYKGSTFTGLIALTLLVLVAASAAHGEDFYQGKTIRFVVGYSPGGVYDIYARLTARHIGRHLQGTPNVVVKNIAGEGSLKAARYVTERAKPDGLTVGIWNSIWALREALGDKNAGKVRHQKVGWVGAGTAETVTCNFTKASGIDSFDKLMKSQEPIEMGATQPGSPTWDLPTMMNEYLKTKLKVEDGYKSVASILQAMRSGEVDGLCSTSEPILMAVQPMAMVRDDDVPISVVIYPRGHNSQFAGLPTFPEVFKKYGGDDAQATIEAYLGPTQFMRPLAVPPSTPEVPLDTLRKAFAATMLDLEFLKAAKKPKLVINAVTGKDVEKRVKKIFSITAKVKKSLASLVMKKK